MSEPPLVVGIGKILWDIAGLMDPIMTAFRR
jgi:hypothetical protein